MTKIMRTLAANAAGVAVILLGLMALAAAKLWRRWDRWKTRRLIGQICKYQERQQKAQSTRCLLDGVRKGA